MRTHKVRPTHNISSRHYNVETLPPGTPRRLSAALHSLDQLGQRDLEPRGDTKQRHDLTVGFARLEFLESVHVHSGLMRQRLLGQDPLVAEPLNLGTEFL